MLTVNVESEFDLEVLAEAIRHLEAAVQGDERNVRYRKTLGEAYIAARQFAQALDQLLAVYESRHEPRVAYLIAYSYFRLGDADAAEKYIELAADASTVGFARLHMLRGRLLFERGVHGEAANEFAHALLLKPKAHDARWQQARALIAHAERLEDDTFNLYRRAEKLLREHEPTKEQLDEWHYLLGRAYLALQYPVEALRHLEQTRHPTHGAKSMLVGLAYLLDGDADQARRWLGQAIRDPDVRERCTEYLVEVAATPSDRQRVDLSQDMLVAIFGEGAPEIARIKIAAKHGGQEPHTRVEETEPRGRLFASQAAETADDDVTEAEPGRPVTAEEPVLPADKLEPKTLLDIKGSERAASEVVAEADEDDEELLADIPDAPPVDALADDDEPTSSTEGFEFAEAATIVPDEDEETTGFGSEDATTLAPQMGDAAVPTGGEGGTEAHTVQHSVPALDDDLDDDEATTLGLSTVDRAMSDEETILAPQEDRTEAVPRPGPDEIRRRDTDATEAQPLQDDVDGDEPRE